MTAPAAVVAGQRGWRRCLRALLWLCGAAFCSSAAWAQTLEELALHSQGQGAGRIVRLRLNAAVRLVQLAPTTASDLYTLRFEVLAADEGVLRQTAEESRRLAAGEGLPDIGVVYAPDASQRIKQLNIRLGQAVVMLARQGPNGRSIDLVFGMGAAPAAAMAAAPVASAADAATAAAAEAAATAAAAVNAAANAAALAEVEREANELMAQARKALAARQGDDAVALLGQLLKLPPNGQSMDAQGLIGAAWLLAGNPDRARIEDALYLKLYPQAEGARAVAQRLAALGGPLPATAAVAGTGVVPNRNKAWSGSLAQYYYGGKARNNSLVNIATGIDRATLSRTTESAIVTSLDLSGRVTGLLNADGETRAVVRGSGSNNLLSTGHSTSSISSAYVEQRMAGVDGLAVRAGRQSPISGGLLGLFDGVSLVYPVVPGLKIDIMGGVPASALVSAPSEKLFAAVLEVDNVFDRFGGNLYLLEQSTQGISNRRALGSELRYSADKWSLNTLLDYDTVFGKLNALSLHGSMQLGDQLTVTLLADQRRAPSLQLTNALISSGEVSLKTMLQTYTLAEIRNKALDTSATAKQFLVSVSQPLSPKWQASADLRYSAIGALPEVGDFQATPATGAQVSFSAQLTGTNLYSGRDINNFNLSVMHTPYFDGVQFSYNNLTGLLDNHDLTVEPSLRVYTQKAKDDSSLTRVGPGVRLSYKASQRASLLGELLFEVSRTRGPTNQDSSSSVFFYVGYRYELF